MKKKKRAIPHKQFYMECRIYTKKGLVHLDSHPSFNINGITYWVQGIGWDKWKCFNVRLWRQERGVMYRTSRVFDLGIMRLITGKGNLCDLSKKQFKRMLTATKDELNAAKMMIRLGGIGSK